MGRYLYHPHLSWFYGQPPPPVSRCRQVRAFYRYFIESLPLSLDLFATLYDDTSHDVGAHCDKFAKYKMRQERREAQTEKVDTTSDGSICPVWTVAVSEGEGEERKEEAISNVMYIGLAKKSHVITHCWTRTGRKTKLRRSKMKSSSLGKNWRRARRKPARSPGRGLCI